MDTFEPEDQAGSADIPPDKRKTAESPKVGAARADATPQRESVLLLDDIDDLRFVLKEVLEHLGYDVISCDGGKVALEILGTTKELPNLIICDISMPGMDGYTFFREVRKNPTWNGIYFVFMSGSKDDRRAALEHGAEDYVAKPFPIADLMLVLEKYRTWRNGRDA